MKTRVLVVALGLILLLGLGAAVQVSREEFDGLVKRVAALDAKVRLLKVQVDSMKEPPDAALKAPAKPGSVLGSWQGTGAKSTGVFRATAPWRIEWQATGGLGIIQVWVYESGAELPTDLVVNERTSGARKQGETFVHAGGQFYLNISSANCKWSVRAIQEAAQVAPAE